MLCIVVVFSGLFEQVVITAGLIVLKICFYHHWLLIITKYVFATIGYYYPLKNSRSTVQWILSIKDDGDCNHLAKKFLLSLQITDKFYITVNDLILKWADGAHCN